METETRKRSGGNRREGRGNEEEEGKNSLTFCSFVKFLRQCVGDVRPEGVKDIMLTILSLDSQRHKKKRAT